MALSVRHNNYIRCDIYGHLAGLLSRTIVRQDLFSGSGMAGMLVSRVALIWFGCALCLSVSSVARASQKHSGVAIASEVANERADFDIPAQPLMAALRAYSEATGLAVLVDDSLSKGRTSSAVQGRFTAPEALQRLLIATGLDARYASPSSFTLMRRADAADASPGQAAPTESDAAESPASSSYARTLQATLERALCQSERIRPGGYRLAMQLWLNGSGRVQRTQLLGSTGLEARDAEIVGLINGLVFRPAPASSVQPFTILLLPSKSPNAFDCSPYRASRH